MSNMPLGLPCGIVQSIPRPVNQILEVTPMAMLVKDGLHLKLRLALDKDKIRG